MTLATPAGWERWEPIPGFPGYEVSTRLRVRSYLAHGWAAEGHRCHLRDRPEPRLLAYTWMPDSRWPYVALKPAGGKQTKRSLRQLYRLAFGADPDESLRPPHPDPGSFPQPQESPSS